MKKITLSLVLFLCSLSLFIPSCKKDFLEVLPQGQLSDELLANKKGVEGLLIGAYGMLKGYDWVGGSSNWLHGSVQGGDANKGGDAGECCNPYLPVQRFELNPVWSQTPRSKWGASYEGISRANATLRVLSITPDDELTAADKARISGEARFLRGHYYFELKRLFNNVPFIDEKMTIYEAEKVPNTADIWPKIEEDFKYAFENLPAKQVAVGRANKWAAAAYLAKTYLYQHKFAEAKDMFDQVIAEGTTAGGLKYDLLEKYATLFNAEYDNNKESIFANQAAVNTGSELNANYEFILNYPYSLDTTAPGGCCGYYQPSFELANSFRTDANGLPLLDGSYNDSKTALKTDFDIKSDEPFAPDAGNLDPRLDHSIGRRGIPYLDWKDHPGDDWIRQQSFGGPYSPKKFIYYKSQEGTLTDGSSWTRGLSAMNYNIIRFADVLLMAAECEVELGNLEKAREYVNRVRARATYPAGFVKRGDGSDAANYVIGLYENAWTNAEEARKAVRFERKLELSGEGHRFFDLVRWGVANEEINKYLQYEGAILKWSIGGAYFTPNKNEYYPIPQSEIDILGEDILKQNPGY